MVDVNAILHEAFLKGASDIHLMAGLSPAYRICGQLCATARNALSAENLQEIFSFITDNCQKEKFKKRGEIDFVYSLESSRYRINAFLQRGTIAFAIRVINAKIPTLSEIEAPDILKTLALKPSGLILAVGPTGSGKSTTLAAMIDFINKEKHAHIITIEDPVEYLHLPRKSMISQREIKSDAKNFAKALRGALRQDPDVILVGEMRDLKTIEVTITAAETGHLVLSTLHTKDAPAAVERIIHAFAPHQRNQAQVQLASVLEGVVAQKLLPRSDETKMAAAMEILVATPAVRNLIREGKTHQLNLALQTGAEFGMQTFERALQDLTARKIIDKTTF